MLRVSGRKPSFCRTLINGVVVSWLLIGPYNFALRQAEAQQSGESQADEKKGTRKLNKKAPRTGESPIRLLIATIADGNRLSSFGGNDAKFRTTPLYRAAQSVGVNLRAPRHPLVSLRLKNHRLFYVFYNTLRAEHPKRHWIVQRVKKTIKNYPPKGPVETQVSYLVEIHKTNGQTTKKPDLHFGGYSLGRYVKREIIKEFEVGFADVPDVAEGDEWPFEDRVLFKTLHSYIKTSDIYNRIQFHNSLQWQIAVSFDRQGNYHFAVPQLPLNLNRVVPPVETTSAKD